MIGRVVRDGPKFRPWSKGGDTEVAGPRRVMGSGLMINEGGTVDVGARLDTGVWINWIEG